GTKLTPFLRTGSTPAPDAKQWTDWVVFATDFQPAESARGHRWAQLKFELTTTRAQATPRLPARFEFVYVFQVDPPPPLHPSAVPGPRRGRAAGHRDAAAPQPGPVRLPGAVPAAEAAARAVPARQGHRPGPDRDGAADAPAPLGPQPVAHRLGQPPGRLDAALG